jgi:hypothetical protein
LRAQLAARRARQDGKAQATPAALTTAATTLRGMRLRPLAAARWMVLLALTGCGGDQKAALPNPKDADPGIVHAHGLQIRSWPAAVYYSRWEQCARQSCRQTARAVSASGPA